MNLVRTSTALKRTSHKIKKYTNEMKNNLQGINSRIDEAENQSNDFD